MRDFLAPVIEGLDLSGIVSALSYQCDQFFENGDNGGTLLDGSTVHDVLAAKARISWTLNSLSSPQYAQLTAALRSGDSLDTVRAYFYDAACNAVRYAKLHVSPPQFRFAFNPTVYPNKTMAFAGAELALDEAEPIARFEASPPARTDFTTGEPLDFDGLAVIRYDKNNVPDDITEQCATVPQNGAVFDRPAALTLSVFYGAAELARFPLTVADVPVIAGGDWWTLYANGSLVVFCVGDMPINYPDNAPWHDYRDSIRTAAIRDGATSVAANAFQDCANLQSASIPDGVTSIGTYAFLNCYALASAAIPDSVTKIAGGAFMSCAALESAAIPDGATLILAEAFRDCANLASVAIPESVSTIGAYAFYDTALTEVTISRNAEVGEHAFPDGCVINYYPAQIVVYGDGWDLYDDGLLDVHFVGDMPNFTGASGEPWYDYRVSVLSISISDTVTSIGNNAFRACYKLTSVTIPDSVTSIGYSAFMGCSKLSSVALPDRVTIIKNSAFYGCNSLTSLTIPAGVTNIPYEMCAHCLDLTSVAIPYGVTSIGASAFTECRVLKDITIPDSVTSIQNSAFYNCWALTDFTIPDSVASIGNNAFTQCFGLTSVAIPDGVTRIASETFLRCSSLASATIPDSVTLIMTGAFGGCSALTDVYYSGTETQWNNMTIQSSNDPLINATIHYNSAGPS